jgi:hypothetical protein
MNMTKFENVDDPGFKAVAGELRRWVKESIQPRNARSVSPRRSVNEENNGRQALRISQGGSQFYGQTTVSGGSLFQGNYIGRDGGIF